MKRTPKKGIKSNYSVYIPCGTYGTIFSSIKTRQQPCRVGLTSVLHDKNNVTHTYIYILYYIYIYKYIHMQHTESTHRSPTFHALIARNSESNPSPSEPSETSRELRLRLSHIGGWAQMAARGGRAAGAFTGRRGGL